MRPRVGSKCAGLEKRGRLKCSRSYKNALARDVTLLYVRRRHLRTRTSMGITSFRLTHDMCLGSCKAGGCVDRYANTSKDVNLFISTCPTS